MTSASQPKPPSDLARRSLIGALLIALAVVAVWIGGHALWLLAALASLFMLAEWADLAKASAKDKRIALFSLTVPLSILSPLAAGPSFFALGLIAGAGFFATIVTRMPRLGWGIAYCGLPALALLSIRGLPDGAMLVFWTLGVVWATDIGAYFAGRTIGGPKLAPVISPNKTWAGLIGGMVAALVFGLLLSQLAVLPIGLAIASPLLALIAQIGDLYESWLKRKAGVKDSGSILPGHGGVLDRLDGLVPVAPAVAALLLLERVL